MDNNFFNIKTELKITSVENSNKNLNFDFFYSTGKLFKVIVQGFRQDLEELFNRFITPDDNEETSSEETPKQISLRFSRFCGIWRQMNFSLVFRHRLNENDLREFVDEIYLLVLPFVGSEYPLERRVFAIYLLYSLFAKQPKSISHKLRINFSYLQQIRELIQICKQLEQMDVVFIWYKLWSLGAIDVVLVSRNMGPLFIRNSRRTEGMETKTDFLFDQFKISISHPFNELSHIHEKYRTLKEELIEDMPNIRTDLSVAEENIFESGKALAEKSLKISAEDLIQLAVQPTANPEANNSGADVSEESDDSIENIVPDIGAKRRQLKERLFGSQKKTRAIAETDDNLLDKTLNIPKKPSKPRGRPRVSKLTEVFKN